MDKPTCNLRASEENNPGIEGNRYPEYQVGQLLLREKQSNQAVKARIATLTDALSAKNCRNFIAAQSLYRWQ
jgi:hypothetical protein